MKKRDLREKSIEELQALFFDLDQKIAGLRFQNKVTPLKNPMEIRIMRKNIAQIKTLISENKSNKL